MSDGNVVHFRRRFADYGLKKTLTSAALLSNVRQSHHGCWLVLRDGEVI